MSLMNKLQQDVCRVVLIISSMEDTYSWEADSLSPDQEIPRLS
jgi:hypothetical protein